MSRHVLNQKRITWEFGWDATKGSFFIEKYRNTRSGHPKKHREPSRWTGPGSFDSMPTLEEFMKVAKENSLHISPDMRAQLYSDQVEEN